MIFVDSHGISHPHRLGVASYFGLLGRCANTIGIAKKRLCGEFATLDVAAGSLAPLEDKGEQLWWVWRSKAHCKLLFISTDHRINADSAFAWMQCCMAGYRLPEPTRCREMCHRFSPPSFPALAAAASIDIAMSDFEYTAA